MKFSSILFALFLAFSLQARGTEMPLQIVSTPNPNVFPLLVALHDHPDLPVRLIPVRNNADIDLAFEQGADGLLAMTYAIAQKASDGRVPDLALAGVYFWRGFFEMTLTEAHSFKELKGKGLIVSGPVSGGSGGAPDMLFRAALAREGMTAGDFSICYLPVMQGVKLLESGKPMDSNAACQSTVPAAGILLVEPASSGLKLESSMPLSSAKNLQRGIDIQKLFSGYREWQSDELPHGGFAIRRSSLKDPAKKMQYAAFLQAYREAIDKINHADGVLSRIGLGHTISNGMDQYFGRYQMSLPAVVVANAIGNGEMRFRNDYTINSIQSDLTGFLQEVLGGKMLPAGFFLDQTEQVLGMKDTVRGQQFKTDNL